MIVKKRILAIDDEVRVLTMIRKRLEFTGYEVITATDGREGLQLARSEKPDLIVLDIILPNLDGYQICARLKADESLKNIPILMLTARSQAKDVEEGMKVGADAYMTKPYDPELFVKQVESLLEEVEVKVEVEKDPLPLPSEVSGER